MGSRPLKAGPLRRKLGGSPARPRGQCLSQDSRGWCATLPRDSKWCVSFTSTNGKFTKEHTSDSLKKEGGIFPPFICEGKMRITSVLALDIFAHGSTFAFLLGKFKKINYWEIFVPKKAGPASKTKALGELGYDDKHSQNVMRHPNPLIFSSALSLCSVAVLDDASSLAMAAAVKIKLYLLRGVCFLLTLVKSMTSCLMPRKDNPCLGTEINLQRCQKHFITIQSWYGG